MELDYRTGEVLDAIKSAGVEDNTIVIWLSDNGSPRPGLRKSSEAVQTARSGAS